MSNENEGAYLPGEITFIDEENVDALGGKIRESFTKRIEEIDRLTMPPLAVVIEGVTLYLSPAEIAELHAELRSLPKFREKEQLVRARRHKTSAPEPEERARLLALHRERLLEAYR